VNLSTIKSRAGSSPCTSRLASWRLEPTRASHRKARAGSCPGLFLIPFRLARVDQILVSLHWSNSHNTRDLPGPQRLVSCFMVFRRHVVHENQGEPSNPPGSFHASLAPDVLGGSFLGMDLWYAQVSGLANLKLPRPRQDETN